MDLAYENSYPTPVAYSPLLPFLLLSLMRQRNSPIVAEFPKEEYDFIIVGAGSAGSVVANRLTEIPCVSVLLLEAGKSPPVVNDVPGFASAFWFSDLSWQYNTVPQKNTGSACVNKQVSWPSGKGLGGSSTLNGMLYVRGNKKNYDDWVQQGAEGWSYEEVLPYFKKLENNSNIDDLDRGYHGRDGPVSVARPKYHAEVKTPIIEAALAMGYKSVDANGDTQTGFYNEQASIRDNQRCSTAKAYLVPAENRTNLDILTNAFVKKIVIEEGRATSVIFEYRNATREVKVRREVILSAGTTNTAQLLMLSGIGHRDHLEELDIPVIADLPVGDNMQDHCSAFVNFLIDPSIPVITKKLEDPSNVRQYIDHRSGPLSTIGGVSWLAFLKDNTSTPSVDFPNYQLYLAEGATDIYQYLYGVRPEVYKQLFEPYENKPFFLCAASLIQPKSRGTVRLNSTDPFDPPLIDPNYFSDPRDFDDMIQGLKMCNKIGKSRAMQKIGSTPFKTLYPGCEDYSADEDSYLLCQIKSLVVTMNHQVGTARMGDVKDATTVVDPKLRVKGVQGLRVVDASVMPIVPSGNTNIPVIMVAEKASDIIKEDIKC